MSREIDIEELLAEAAAVRRRAYAPYSEFLVGAALRDERGRVHVGCNVENAAYPLGACAEVHAIGAMIAAGGSRIATIAIVGGRGAAARCLPCGGCRQRIAEFADADTEIVVLDRDEGIERFTVKQLLPEPFSL